MTQPASIRLPFTFGIYPGGAAGTPDGMTAGPPDEPVRIQAALDLLQGDADAFYVRGYLPYQDAPDPRWGVRETPDRVEQYLGEGRLLDLVLQFQSESGDVDGWTEFVRAAVEEYGDRPGKLQIAEEPNVRHAPLDGSFPRVREAVVAGVVAAKDEARRRGYDGLLVGFNAVPSIDPADDFWPSLGALADDRFYEALDFAGFDFFPDVFRPLAPDGQPWDRRSAVQAVLRKFRGEDLARAGIGRGVPIHIAENGWPTSPTRPLEEQARAVETIVRAIYEVRAELGIVAYEHFCLRDADSGQADMMHQFGLLRDDYAPKPAFEVYRRLIAELTVT
jgi:hypothetical protein